MWLVRERERERGGAETEDTYFTLSRVQSRGVNTQLLIKMCINYKNEEDWIAITNRKLYFLIKLKAPYFSLDYWVLNTLAPNPHIWLKRIRKINLTVQTLPIQIVNAFQHMQCFNFEFQSYNIIWNEFHKQLLSCYKGIISYCWNSSHVL